MINSGLTCDPKQYSLMVCLYVKTSMKAFAVFLLLTTNTLMLNAQVAVPVISFSSLESRLQAADNTTTWVVNFWATWCAPCIREIPYFEMIGETYADAGVKILLVSLDRSESLQSRLIPFIEQRSLKSEILLLDDPNSNAWIPKVSPDWTGSIPATLIFNKNHRAFYEKEFTYEELKNAVDTALNAIHKK